MQWFILFTCRFTWGSSQLIPACLASASAMSTKAVRVILESSPSRPPWIHTKKRVFNKILKRNKRWIFSYTAPAYANYYIPFFYFSIFSKTHFRKKKKKLNIIPVSEMHSGLPRKSEKCVCFFQDWLIHSSSIFQKLL